MLYIQSANKENAVINFDEVVGFNKWKNLSGDFPKFGISIAFGVHTAEGDGSIVWVYDTEKEMDEEYDFLVAKLTALSFPPVMIRSRASGEENKRLL